MQLKLAAEQQRHRFVKDWMENVWLKWPEKRSMKNLQQLDPEGLPKALHVEPADLPETLKDHPYRDMEIIR